MPFIQPFSRQVTQQGLAEEIVPDLALQADAHTKPMKPLASVGYGTARCHRCRPDLDDAPWHELGIGIPGALPKQRDDIQADCTGHDNITKARLVTTDLKVSTQGFYH